MADLILNALIQKGLRQTSGSEGSTIALILNALIQKGLRRIELPPKQHGPDIECPDSKGIKTSSFILVLQSEG